MSAPMPTLGNTPGQANTPDELKKEGLVWMGTAPERGEQPVIVFYRTLRLGNAFAPNTQNIDPKTGQPRLVYPVTVDMYFPNGPLAGRVYRKVGFIGQGISGPIRETAIGSINVGQLGVGLNSGNRYPQLNGLDADALVWATEVHKAAGGDVFAYYSGEPSEPVVTTTPAAPAVQDRFAGQAPPPPPGQAQQAAAAPAQQPQGPPPGMPGAQAGPPPGMPGAAQPAAAVNGQPAPLGGPPPAGVPTLGPPPGMPGYTG